MTILIQTATNIIVAIITGWVVGYFGTRLAIRRYAAERAFDRQIEWYKQTIGAVTEFRNLNERIALALRHDEQELWKKVMETLDKSLEAFQRTLNDSLMYAESKIYNQLKASMSKCQKINDEVAKLIEVTGGLQFAEHYESLVGELDQVLFELASPMRKKLGLDKIEIKDFEK